MRTKLRAINTSLSAYMDHLAKQQVCNSFSLSYYTGSLAYVCLNRASATSSIKCAHGLMFLIRGGKRYGLKRKTISENFSKTSTQYRTMHSQTLSPVSGRGLPNAGLKRAKLDAREAAVSGLAMEWEDAMESGKRRRPF